MGSGILGRRRLARQGRRGIVLVAVCLSLFLLLAGLGLGVDLNRYAAEQAAGTARAEAAALGAALELDGSAAGLERARARAAAALPGGYLEFSDSLAGPWQSHPLNFAEVRAARMRASSEMALSLLRGVIDRRSLPVRVAARAGQRAIDRVEAGLRPWAIPAALATQPEIALPPDLTAPAAEAKDGGARRLIFAGLNQPVRAGDRLPAHADPAPGLSASALAGLIATDTDPDSATYAAYREAGHGNGRRVILLPLVDRERRVTGFAGFFLLGAGRLGRVEPAGSFLEGSAHSAAAPSGAWRVELAGASPVARVAEALSR